MRGPRAPCSAWRSLNKRHLQGNAGSPIHGALGEMDDSLRWYEKAFADRTTNMVYAPIMPLLSPELAGDVRYQAIVDHMGFPPTGTQ